MDTMPEEFFLVILCWKRYYTSEMSNTQLIVSSLMEVPAELMVCRSITFVTTSIRIGKPFGRIFSLALTSHKLFGKLRFPKQVAASVCWVSPRSSTELFSKAFPNGLG